MIDNKLKIGFIGLGLIGGSLAKGFREYLPNCTIVAFDKSKESLALAALEGVINQFSLVIDDTFKDCDFIFLCAPVSFNNAYLKQVKKYLNKNCILTDVGSVKSPLHRAVAENEMEENFIGGHPMTGSEKSGYSNSDPIIFENAYYILSPTTLVAEEKIVRLKDLICTIKSLPLILDPMEHDYSTGIVSHLPHILAATLVDFTRQKDTKEHLLRNLAAGGFKDITRIASSSPTMWEHICAQNGEFIVQILEDYINSLTEVTKLIKEENSTKIYELFTRAKDYRSQIEGNGSGAIKKEFTIYCDLKDEAGGIATIATLLASATINIKNIGILHNREFEEGVLHINFYNLKDKKKATEILQDKGYIVYEY
ncbi:MAG TPA: prephenate dehydrogenase [Candidatus Dorea intestinavium]|nr:prephenate dehydrogenase [Candidatus Dorea intestinavium]